MASLLAGRITLYKAFFTMLMDRPALMLATEAPSFWACLTLLFINTVQRLPKSTGISALRPICANCSAV